MESVNEDTNTPQFIIEGMDVIIRRDLDKHKNLLEIANNNLLSYREAVSHQVKKKKHYSKLIGGGEFNDNSLRESIQMINVDIRHLSDKVKLTNDEINHHKEIVDTLTQQLEDYGNRSRSLQQTH